MSSLENVRLTSTFAMTANTARAVLLLPFNHSSIEDGPTWPVFDFVHLEDEQKQARDGNPLITGNVGGAAQVLVGQPLDTIKMRTQASPC